MSTSEHQKEKPRMKSELSLVNEGTSARTRPFSCEDVMLRRKSKIIAETQAALGDSDDRKHVNEIAAKEREINKGISSQLVQSSRGDSRRASEDLGRVSSKKKERNMHGVDERKSKKDRSGEKRKLEAKSNLSLRKDHNRKDTPRGKSDKYADDRKRSNRSNEDSRNESRQTRSGNVNCREISGGKTNGRFVKERVLKQGLDSDRKQSYRRRDADQSRHDHINVPNIRHKRPSGRVNEFFDRGRRAADKESEGKHQGEIKEKTRDLDTKKHHKHTAKELSGRNEKESSTVHQEETRIKRKRSGSREHDKDKSRRSASLSPRAQKRRSLGDQHNSSKEKFQKPHTDTERRKISSDGSNGNQRRYFGSSSGLGGYSPRKRKTEAGASTPSPPPRSPGRRTAGWDHLATRKDSNINSSLVSDLQLSIQTAMQNDPKPPSVISDISVTVKPGVSQYAPSSQMHAIDSVQLTQATRPMRRLYVESLPSSASEKDVLECVNSFLLSSGVNHIIGTLPCISCMINKEKNQALLEFLTPEDASAALTMNGRMFSGSLLRIRRPRDFVEPITGVRDKPLDEAHVISDTIEDSSHTIFIGGISKLISSEMLVKIAGAFGSLKAFHLEHNKGTDVHYAFLEYVDHLVTQKACAGLNGMKLGGQVLTVVQVTRDAPSLGDDDLRCLYGVPEHAKPLLKPPTRILKLQNVFDSEGISPLSEPELEEILEDIKLECARFGSVKGANVVRQISDFTRGNGSDVNHKHGVDEVSQESLTPELAESDNSKPLNCISEDVQVEEAEGGDVISDGNTTICTLRENEDTSRTSVSNSVSCDNLVGNVPEDDEACEATLEDRDPTKTSTARQEIISVASGECTNPPDDSTGQMVNNDDVSDVSPVEASEMQNMATVAEISVLEVDASFVSQGNEKVPDSEDCFEVGSVLVEFKREEASCMAAHCLHGRLFDGRVVSAEYVDPDLYLKKFPSKT